MQTAGEPQWLSTQFEATLRSLASSSRSHGGSKMLLSPASPGQYTTTPVVGKYTQKSGNNMLSPVLQAKDFTREDAALCPRTESSIKEPCEDISITPGETRHRPISWSSLNRVRAPSLVGHMLTTDHCTKTLEQRFGGVVGYRICLTHRRSPVRARAESFFSQSS